jgi:hypothetical protein
MSTMTIPVSGTAVRGARRSGGRTHGVAIAVAAVAALSFAAVAGAASADDSDSGYSGPPQWLAAVDADDVAQGGFGSGDLPTYAETAVSGRAVATPTVNGD